MWGLVLGPTGALEGQGRQDTLCWDRRRGQGGEWRKVSPRGGAGTPSHSVPILGDEFGH